MRIGQRVPHALVQEPLREVLSCQGIVHLLQISHVAAVVAAGRAEAEGRRLVVAALCGGIAPAGVAVALAVMLGLAPEVVRSIAPKSVTAPVAMGIAERLGRVPALAALFSVLTGMVGAVSARPLFGLLGIRSYAVRGFALGTAAHGIGAAWTLQVDEDARAYAGIAWGLQVLIASLFLPIAGRVMLS